MFDKRSDSLILFYNSFNFKEFYVGSRIRFKLRNVIQVKEKFQLSPIQNSGRIKNGTLRQWNFLKRNSSRRLQ